MKLPPIRKILREDLQDAPSWVTSIIDPINTFMDGIYLILNNNVTFADNITSFVRQVPLVTTSSYPTMAPFSFPNPLKVKVMGILSVNCYITNNYVPDTVTSVAWTEVNGQITITQILGLQVSTSYTITLLIF